ncbi:MAG: hypothetical protein CM1200mP23_2040 [Nitrososphaerota archaeon]|nr:MAG: hypothetical protein CM1200mP23_2040 [Nitrososphaerota archaeon]
MELVLEIQQGLVKVDIIRLMAVKLAEENVDDIKSKNVLLIGTGKQQLWLLNLLTKEVMNLILQVERLNDLLVFLKH